MLMHLEGHGPAAAAFASMHSIRRFADESHYFFLSFSAWIGPAIPEGISKARTSRPRRRADGSEHADQAQDGDDGLIGPTTEPPLGSSGWPNGPGFLVAPLVAPGFHPVTSTALLDLVRHRTNGAMPARGRRPSARRHATL
jgi:hypothetical protein